MNIKFVLWLTAVVNIFSGTVVKVSDARHVVLRPLSGKEVVRILKLAGREDAVPEGRVVTQGLAAASGFALGLTKGIGGALLVDLATSNATAEFINNFNMTSMMGDYQGINMTALMQMFQWGSKTTSNGTRYKTTEMCFSTAEDPTINEMARQAPTPTTPTTGTAAPTGTANTPPISGTGTGTGTSATTPTSSSTATSTAPTSGTGVTGGTNTNTGTGSGTNIDTGTATNTQSSTSTATGTGDSTTCIVFQKPIVRKRRSPRRRRKRSF